MWADERQPEAPTEDGFALIASLLVTVIVSAVVLVLVSTAIGGLRGSSGHRDREGAVHAADAAAEVIAERIAADPNHTTGHTWPFASTPTPDQERQWARSALAAALAASPRPASLLRVPSVSCASTAATCPSMDALGIRPTGPSGPMNVVYGVSAASGRSADEARVVRLAVERDGYTVPRAILTQLALKIDADLIVQGNHGHIHTNGAMEVRKNTYVSGNVTASGAIDGQTRIFTPPGSVVAAFQPTVPLPNFSALSYYGRRFEVPEQDWYDLCPDGRAHARSAGAPCTGPIRPTPNGFRTGGGGRWEINGTAYTDGVFYVHERDFVISGNPGLNAAVRPRLTVIVAKQPVDCGAGGNIDIDSDGWINPYLPDGTLFIGDREIRLRRKAVMGEAAAPAFVGAGGIIRTDNEPTLHGAFFGLNTCPGELNELKGKPQITYSGNLTLGIGGGGLRLGVWNEL